MENSTCSAIVLAEEHVKCCRDTKADIDYERSLDSVVMYIFVKDFLSYLIVDKAGLKR